jgi:hypothetical protein
LRLKPFERLELRRNRDLKGTPASG